MAKTASKSEKPDKPVGPDEESIRRMAAERLSRVEPDCPKLNAKRSRAVEEAFLDGLRGGWSVRKSAWSVGISSKTAYDWRNASEATRQEDGSYKDDFARRWATAYEDGVDRLEDEVVRRAVVGVERPVYQGGTLVGTVTEYSDTLLTLAMHGKRPERYNTKRVELTGANGGPVAMSMELEFVDPPRGAKK